MSNDILELFKQELVADGKALKTIISYTGDVRDFLIWLESKSVDFDGKLSRMYVTQYKEYLVKKEYAVDTINKKVNSLSCFNHYLIREKYTQELAVHPRKDKVKVAKGSEGEVEVLSDEEMERLLFYLEGKGISIRNKLMVHILLYTGVRASELVGIRIKDIDFLTSHLKVIGKGGKVREIPLKSELLELMKHYIETERAENKNSDSEYLLLSQRARKIDRDTTNKVINKIAGELNIKLYPHKFRHTFCSMLIRKGVAITTVSKIAGHASVNTTMDYYINTSREEKQKAVELL